jgi:steroid delta-isomerase-like uncharacterized protein
MVVSFPPNMKDSTPAEIAHLWFEKLWNRRDYACVHELMAPHARGFLEGDEEIAGPEGFLKFQQAILSAMPDLHIEVVDLIEKEKDVCVQWKATGHHTGDGLGFLPTGREVLFKGVTWLAVDSGQVVAGRDFWNKDGLMRKLAGEVDA